jgi:hypothetical protein
VKLSERVYWWFRRWYYTIRFAKSWAKQLNRRVEVENVLFAVAAGKRDLLSRDECRALAYKLGNPQ